MPATMTIKAMTIISVRDFLGFVVASGFDDTVGLEVTTFLVLVVDALGVVDAFLTIIIIV